MVVLGGAVSYERGTHVGLRLLLLKKRAEVVLDALQGGHDLETIVSIRCVLPHGWLRRQFRPDMDKPRGSPIICISFIKAYR